MKNAQDVLSIITSTNTTAASPSGTSAPLLTQVTAPMATLDRHLAGCNKITSCSCTGDEIRSKFDREVCVRAPANEELTILHLGAGAMKQLFSTSLKLIEEQKKKVHAIAIESTLIMSDRWYEGVDIYIDPPSCKVDMESFANSQLPELIDNGQLPRGEAICIVDVYLFDILDGQLLSKGTPLNNAYFLQKLNQGKPLADLLLTLDPSRDLTEDKKLVISDANREQVREFLKYYLPLRGKIDFDAEAILTQMDVVKNRINAVHGDDALKITRFSTVFSYYLACRADRAEIMESREKFDAAFAEFSAKYPGSIPSRFHQGSHYVSCQYDYELNADIINQRELFALDMAVSIDLEAKKRDTEVHCFKGLIEGSQLVDKSKTPAVVSAQKQARHGYWYSDELFTPQEKFVSENKTVIVNVV